MAGGGNVHDTPAMRQFRSFKERYPDCVLFFRMGDFYETFYDDAKLAHKVLGVTLTQRTKGIAMAGVPYHSVEGYLRRMIQAGYRVAVCDQVEDAAQAKGIVRREVTRVITPGTLTDESLLEEETENPLAAVVVHDGSVVSVAWAELSTGAFRLTTINEGELPDELARIAPRELLYPEPDQGVVDERVRSVIELLGCASAARPAWQFRQAEAVETLCKQYGVTTLEGFGLSPQDPALGAASGVIHYLRETQSPPAPGSVPGSTPGSAQGGNIGDGVYGGRSLGHLQPPCKFARHDYLVIDHTSLRSLEIERTARSGEVEGSLLAVLQGCVTAMGKRALRSWLCYPCCSRGPIEQRQRVVAAMVEDERFRDELTGLLENVQDVQRIAGRVAVGRATPRDLMGLGKSSGQARALGRLLGDRPAVEGYLQRLVAVSDPLQALAATLTEACVEAPPAHLREGGLIRDGFDADLDEARSLQHDSHTWLGQYQKSLVEETGINNLKVGFNKVFGYYIEVTAANKDKAPDHWSRKQTLKNAERYITPPLKEFEGKVLSARERAIAREQVLFTQLCETATQQLSALNQFAQVVAELDVLACFANRAVRWRYVRPEIVDEPVLEIRGGRHPVLDELLGDRFVPNDVHLGSNRVVDSDEAPEAESGEMPSKATLGLITGPNMAGKSTYIRQAALMTLLAHTGSFVPADSATIGLCDRIFTRIGASDELHAGRSTFMVEMTETANICHHATGKSLVILDEIGRGTSTLDGLSLAWAIAEHLAGCGARTLFATHYHELTGLAQRFENVANLNVTVREWQDQIVFLHRIVPGATDRSYGIHVAKIAGLPSVVVDRANQLLGQLSVSHDTMPAAVGDTTPSGRGSQASDRAPQGRSPSADGQLALFKEYLDHPVVERLRAVDLNRMTPLEAFEVLKDFQQTLDEG